MSLITWNQWDDVHPVTPLALNSCHFNSAEHLLRYRKNHHLRCSFCSPQNFENVSKSWKHIGIWWTNDHCSGLFAIFFLGGWRRHPSLKIWTSWARKKHLALVICCPPSEGKSWQTCLKGWKSQLWSWHHQPRFCFRKTSNVRDGLDQEAVCQKSHKNHPCFLRFCRLHGYICIYMDIQITWITWIHISKEVVLRDNLDSSYTGWWLTYPSEKYDFVSWDDDIPNIWKNKTCSKPQTSISSFKFLIFLGVCTSTMMDFTGASRAHIFRFPWSICRHPEELPEDLQHFRD